MTRAAAAMLFCLVLTACATGGDDLHDRAPVQEMSDARQAVAAAERAGVQASPGGDLQRAQRWLERAREHLRSGDYDAARAAARRARDYAQAARREQAPLR